MGKRLWLFAGAVILASVVMASGATATTMRSSEAVSSASPTVLPPLKGLETPAARKAKDTLVFGAEQDIDGFNTNLNCCNQFWALVMGNTPVIRGVYMINAKLGYVPDLVSKVKVTNRPFSVTYFIKKGAKWSDGKPVSGADFVWSWQKIMDPNSDVTGRDGYDQITGSKVSGGGKVVKFSFKAPYADWKDLFGIGVVLPKHALQDQDYNKIWANCVCDPHTGKPISDGPYLLQSYRKGTDLTLVRNPSWYGPKAKLKKIVFRFIQDTNTEIQAMRGGEVDAIAPSPQTALTSLQHQSGIVYKSTPALYLEHIDLSGDHDHNKLMENAWFRQALIRAINRQSLVKTFFGDIAPNLKVQNSLVFYQTDGRYKPDFNKWSFSASKAKSLLTSHGCRAGGDGIMVCGGTRAAITYITTGTNRRRVLSSQVYKDELKDVGIDLNIKLVPPNVMFGPQGVASGNFDMAEYAWVTSPDPAGFVPWLKCKGESNHMTWCNKKVTKLLNQSDKTLNVKKRASLFNQADAIASNLVPVIPLYSTPSILVYKSSVKGMINNPSVVGPTWNAHLWHF